MLRTPADLDLETLDVLEEMISDYSGTVLVISHDRDFLDRIVSALIVPEGNGRWTEYAGGYSDMLAQRGTDVADANPAASSRKSPAAEGTGSRATAVAASRRRLSFHQQHALKTLPDAIADLERRVRLVQEQLADPTLYDRDRSRFAAASGELAKIQSELAAAEEQWLELELLREEMENGVGDGTR